jgi:hypothetical protein
MKLFRRSRQVPLSPAPTDEAPSLSAEAEVRTAIHEGAERRRKHETFSVLCVTPQAIGTEPEISAEIDAVTRNIAAELRFGDRFCRLENGSYLVLLNDTSDQFANIVAQRLAVNLTVRSGAVRHRKWLVGVAQYPHDAQTESALVAMAQADAAERKTA